MKTSPRLTTLFRTGCDSQSPERVGTLGSMSRDAVLEALRRNLPEETPHPNLANHALEWTRYEDPLSQFETTLRAVGGEFYRVGSVEEAASLVAEQPENGQGKVVCSRVPGVGRTSFDYEGLTDPHELAQVDFAVMPAHFAVAENAACWVTAATPCDRVVHFLTQHLCLVVHGPMLHNLHEAYARIEADERLHPRSVPFAAFISGPSKTADIEQSLVIGAHGSRSLLVVYIDPPA